MPTKRITNVLIWSLWSLFFAQSLADIRAQMGNHPIQIGQSNHPLATAYNNGRRMVRDSNDQRYVVYQDIRGGVPIICFVHSQDGRFWSLPDTLFEGAFPSLAIDQWDRLYLAWQAVDTCDIYFTYSKDSSITWKKPPTKVSQSNSRTQFPVIEAGHQRLHIAWQQDIYLPPVQQIFYTSISLDSVESTFAKPVNISLSEAYSKFPSIAYNLAFSEEGKLHVVWYDSIYSDSSIVTRIRYRAVNESFTTWDPPLSQHSYMLSDDRSPQSVHPAISIGESGEIIHVVWGNNSKDKIHHLRFKYGYLSTSTATETEISADPFICLDDPRVYAIPLVWMTNNEIYYMEIFGKIPINPLYFLLSTDDNINSTYPSVGYKQAKIDSFDVVWVDGNKPPYQIMYQRKPKISIGAVTDKVSNLIPQQNSLKQNYPNPFNHGTIIDYEISFPGFVTLEIYNLLGQKVRTLVNEWKQVGSYQVRWDETNDAGEMVVSGVYMYRLSAGDWIEARKVILLR